MSWKTIPDYSRYEISNRAEIRNRKTRHVYRVFPKYGLPHVTLCRDDGPGRNLQIRYLMAELWPRARGWDRWKPPARFAREDKKKALEMLRNGTSFEEVSRHFDISLGEVILMANRLR